MTKEIYRIIYDHYIKDEREIFKEFLLDTFSDYGRVKAITENHKWGKLFYDVTFNNQDVVRIFNPHTIFFK